MENRITYKNFLISKLRQTNLNLPRSIYVWIDKFPEQDDSLLGEKISIKFRNMSIVDDSEDDLERPEKYEEHDIFTFDECEVIRCDKVEPYRLICKHTHLSKEYVFVTDSRYYQDKVVQYPHQFDEYIGKDVKVFYPDDLENYNNEDICLMKDQDYNIGTIVRCDNGEPCYTVIEESMGEYVRYILLEECLCVIQDEINEE